MEELPKINIIDTAVDLYQFIGETKHETSRKLLIFRVFTSSIYMLILSLIFANFFYVGDELYVPTLQAFLLIAHTLLKYLLLLYYKPIIEILLKDIADTFWNYRRFNKETAQKIETVYKTIKHVQRIVLIICVIGDYAYMLKPFLAVSKGLVLETMVPASYVLDAVILAAQYYCCSVAMPIVIGYDFIYFALCIHVVLQLKLFKQKIKEILKTHDENTKMKLNYCIQHHQFLISFYFRLKTIYSIMLLFHYFVSLISACSMLLEIMLRNTDFINDVAKAIIIVILVGQFALYAFPAEQVAFEFSDVCSAIYASYWYKNKVSNQKTLLYIMVVAQREQYFSGAGLVDINVDAFESMVRKSFSFCAVLRNLINK